MVSIKLLTLNTHSLVEKDYKKKLKAFTETVMKIMPDVIALQEVNQTCDEVTVNDINNNLHEEINDQLLHGFCPCSNDIVIKEDNHAYNIVKLLKEKGIDYYWTWVGMKKGYNKYDEGIAILSRYKIIDTNILLASSCDDYNNWKTRKIIGIQTEKYPNSWFYSVHMGWWNDEEEPFQSQWERINLCMQEHIKDNANVWLMGDFNTPSDAENEGYELIKKSNWFDSYELALEKDDGVTVEEIIDGWHEKNECKKRMRIDYIWCSKDIEIKSSKVVFNGNNEMVVSDHYGIILEI